LAHALHTGLNVDTLTTNGYRVTLKADANVSVGTITDTLLLTFGPSIGSAAVGSGAILSVAGPIEFSSSVELCEKSYVSSGGAITVQGDLKVRSKAELRAGSWIKVSGTATLLSESKTLSSASYLSFGRLFMLPQALASASGAPGIHVVSEVFLTPAFVTQCPGTSTPVTAGTDLVPSESDACSSGGCLGEISSPASSTCSHTPASDCFISKLVCSSASADFGATLSASWLRTYALASCFVSNSGGDLFATSFSRAATSCALPAAWMTGDPHVLGAHGDTFDFKGAHGGIYVLLSTRRLTLSARFVHETFLSPYSKVHIQGSWMKDAFWVVRTRANRLLRVAFHAADPAHYVINNATRSAATVEGDVRISLQQRTLTLTTATWTTRATAQRGRPHPGKIRMDIMVQPLSVEAAYPHGILGQTFDGDHTPHHGRQDSYEFLDDRSRTRDRKGVGGVITTHARGEGGVDGYAEEYRVAHPFDTHFRFSRFDVHHVAMEPRALSHPAVRPLRSDTD